MLGEEKAGGIFYASRTIVGGKSFSNTGNIKHSIQNFEDHTTIRASFQYCRHDK